MRRGLAVVGALIAAAALAAEPVPGRALIWGGGAIPEAGAEALRSFEGEAGRVSTLLALGAGFPKVVESKAIQGLKPGFHVVLLGLCAAGDADLALAAAKSLDARVYARAVQVNRGQLACPSLFNGWALKARQQAGPLTGWVLTKGLAEFKVLALLKDAADEPLDFLAVQGSDAGNLEPTLAVAGSALVAELSHVFGGGCEGVPSVAVDTLRLEVRGKKLKQSLKAGKPSCN